MDKKDFEIMENIVERADNKDLLLFDRISLSMDLEYAFNEFNLNLDGLLKADDFNFSHDIVGIQNNFNRGTKKFENFFVPRYSNFSKKRAE